MTCLGVFAGRLNAVEPRLQRRDVRVLRRNPPFAPPAKFRGRAPGFICASFSGWGQFAEVVAAGSPGV